MPRNLSLLASVLLATLLLTVAAYAYGRGLEWAWRLVWLTSVSMPLVAAGRSRIPFRKFVRPALSCGFGCILILSSTGGIALAEEGADQSSRHEGQHDFDFDFGTWKTHSSRLLHPLSGSKDWVDMDGLTVVKKVWNGRANLAEYKADGPGNHVELMALRYYNPDARQWGVVFATPSAGTLSVPCIGEFRNGRGDFYDQEEFNGRYILVRFSIWRISENTAQSEQAFSDDGGRTWEVNWINRYTRASDDTDIEWPTNTSAQSIPGAHDFDFSFGSWHSHIERFLDPFADQRPSFEFDGTKAARKIWGGRAMLEEIEADTPKGHWQALTLFLFNPKSRQWSQIFLNSQTGVISPALVGSFKGGRGELLQQDTFKGRSILVRGVWSDITPESHRYTEAYSDDGGKTWNPAFIAVLTKAK